jgi:hypothetical protein
MPKPSDVGKIINLDKDTRVNVLMWIKGPKGECYIFDNIWGAPNQYVSDDKCDAIQSFMEFNNG